MEYKYKNVYKKNLTEPLMLEEMSFVNRLEKRAERQKILNINKNTFKGLEFKFKINVATRNNNE